MVFDSFDRFGRTQSDDWNVLPFLHRLPQKSTIVLGETRPIIKSRLGFIKTKRFKAMNIEIAL